MSGSFDIAAEFRAGKSAHRGATLRLRLRHAVAAVQGQWHGDAPTWSDWRARQLALDASTPPSFVAAMCLAHGGSHAQLATASAVTAAPESIVDDRTAWHASRVPMTAANVASVWQGLAAQFQIPDAFVNAVTFKLDASHGQCRVLVPGRSVEVWLRGGASAAAWHDCLHELGHAVVALCTVADVPRAVDEAVADVVAAQSMRTQATSGEDLSSVFSDLAHVAHRMRQHRGAIAQRLAVAEATGQPTDAARPPWALWHDPGAQAAYVAAQQLAAPLLQEGFADQAALLQFVEATTRAIDTRIAAWPGGAW